MPTRFSASGRPSRPFDLGGKRLGIGLRLPDLLGDGVGVVREIDARHVGLSDFDIFLEPSRKLITRVAGPVISGSGNGKKPS